MMNAMASQITILTIVYSTVYSADQIKDQNSTSLTFVRGIHRWPGNSSHKWPVTRKMFPFDDVTKSFSRLLFLFRLQTSVVIATKMFEVSIIFLSILNHNYTTIHIFPRVHISRKLNFLFFFISNIFIQGEPFSRDCSTMGLCLIQSHADKIFMTQQPSKKVSNKKKRYKTIVYNIRHIFTSTFTWEKNI